jgi:hypothetical protein
MAPQQHFEELVRTGKCKYCGQPAAGGSISGGWPGEEHVDLYCEPCQKDYAEFMSRPENKAPDDFREDDDAAMEEMSARLSRLRAAAEHYVRQRAAERRSKR